MSTTDHSRSDATWIDPATAVWGFHVHQEVQSEAAFEDALLVQQACRDHLFGELGAPIDHADCLRPGYGCHLGHMWELRIESVPERALSLLGRAIAWMSVNHRFLGGYIHATMHDESAPALERLRQQGETNQRHAVFFGHARVPQKQSFFFDPPLDPSGSAENPTIEDTRSSRVLSARDVALARTRAASRDSSQFLDPARYVRRGFHIHVDYDPKDAAHRKLAGRMFPALVDHLRQSGLPPTHLRAYEPGENGPHVWAGFEVKFETRDFALACEGLGRTIAWLMCNRGPLCVFAHAVPWEEGDLDLELGSHKNYSFFIGEEPPLRLAYFQDIIDATRHPVRRIVRKVRSLILPARRG